MRWRVLTAVVTMALAGLAMGMAAWGFTDMPECGTGSYFLYPIGPWGAVIVAAAMVTLMAAVVLLLWGPEDRGMLPVLLLGAEAAGAAAGYLVGDARTGCDAYRGHSYLEIAVISTLVAGGVVLAGVLLVWAVVHRSSGPDHEVPALPEGMRLMDGHYLVRRSEVDGVRRGEMVWLAFSPDRLGVLCPNGTLLTMARDGLAADVGEDIAITVSADGWLQLELIPQLDTDPWALSIALDNDAD